jgi:hypothetical protein
MKQTNPESEKEQDSCLLSDIACKLLLAIVAATLAFLIEFALLRVFPREFAFLDQRLKCWCPDVSLEELCGLASD